MSPFLELAAINAEEDQLADVGIGPELEGEGTEFAVVVGGDLDGLAGVGTMPTAGGTSSGRGQVIDDGIKEGLNAAFLEGGTAEHRDHFEFAGQPADGRL